MSTKELGSLNKEQEEFLCWLKEKEPATLAKMHDAQAPGFSEQRVNQMCKDGWIDRKIDVEIDGHIIGVYSVSDKGKAYLERKCSGVKRLFAWMGSTTFKVFAFLAAVATIWTAWGSWIVGRIQWLLGLIK